MIVKCVAVVLLLTAVVSASVIPLEEYTKNQLDQSGNQSHNLIVGGREYGDREVHVEHITKPSSWFQIVTLEKTINIYGASRITQIQAFDQKTNGNGAYANIQAGGPGNNFVTLKFKSQRNHGIDFRVVIWAK
ncbi:hypothetical protein PV325_005564 [Microctonus aethiopoides]|uniref:Salivary secreted peptide n=1 Tax=Microctonus aethiopoides TaxID=144406 RepID=A0AA39KU26_9HYME|nr:hypothetical protein PV325_005564 [Microctonus aethiopoides]KAK0173784.1 hypothetical protein PV328_006931 [Microctonus aethiopoides]